MTDEEIIERAKAYSLHDVSGKVNLGEFIEDLICARDGMARGLNLGVGWFEEYAKIHWIKGDYEKEGRNRKRAEVLRAAFHGYKFAPAETVVMGEIRDELARARAKFPGPNVTTLALMEEVGELAQATFEKSRAEVRKEAVQVAVMAMRVILDGDATLDAWRESKGLDPLVEGKP